MCKDEWNVDNFDVSEIIEFKNMKDIDNQIISIDMKHMGLDSVGDWRRQIVLLIKLIEYRVKERNSNNKSTNTCLQEDVDAVYSDSIKQVAKYLGLKESAIRDKIRGLEAYDFKARICDLFRRLDYETIKNIDSELICIKRSESSGASFTKIDKLVDILKI